MAHEVMFRRKTSDELSTSPPLAAQVDPAAVAHILSMLGAVTVAHVERNLFFSASGYFFAQKGINSAPYSP